MEDVELGPGGYRVHRSGRDPVDGNGLPAASLTARETRAPGAAPSHRGSPARPGQKRLGTAAGAEVRNGRAAEHSQAAVVHERR